MKGNGKGREERERREEMGRGRGEEGGDGEEGGEGREEGEEREGKRGRERDSDYTAVMKTIQLFRDSSQHNASVLLAQSANTTDYLRTQGDSKICGIILT